MKRRIKTRCRRDSRRELVRVSGLADVRERWREMPWALGDVGVWNLFKVRIPRSMRGFYAAQCRMAASDEVPW
jgi:hypothetical protein